MDSFPEDIVDISLGMELYARECCRKERVRLTAIIRKFMSTALENVMGYGYAQTEHTLRFMIEPDDLSVPSHMKQFLCTGIQCTLSRELRQRYPQLEYLDNMTDEWRPVPEDGCSGFTYRILFRDGNS